MAREHHNVSSLEYKFKSVLNTNLFTKSLMNNVYSWNLLLHFYTDIIFVINLAHLMVPASEGFFISYTLLVSVALL